ncbi:MAG: hypothetical protein JSV74_06630 [Dehalococcoidia bacterium]|nr:MAG: hypothetical protein JSV74_06630 [Dehalococcoidia bacterium]
MKKVILIGLVAILSVALASPVMAAKPEWANFGLGGIVGQAGNSSNWFMKLFEKDSTDWTIVEGGAWGKLKYTLTEETFDFHFNGHGLEPSVEGEPPIKYALIYYPDPWPGEGLIIFGSDASNEGGNVHIKGSANIEGLLPRTDEFGEVLDENVIENGGIKVWLVLLSDVDEVDEGENQMAGWQPAEYLFEYDLIPVVAPEVETVTSESTDNNPGNPNKSDKSEKSNNGKGKNK